VRGAGLLIAAGVLALGALGLLLLGPSPTPNGGRVPASSAAAPEGRDLASTGSADRIGSFGLGTPEPADPGPAPERSTAQAAPVANIGRLPRTTQSLHGRVVLPAAEGLRFEDLTARVADARGEAARDAIPSADGQLVLELERTVEGAWLTIEHPMLAEVVMGPFDVALGERRSFGLARPQPVEQRALRVLEPDGAPASGASVWVLPALGDPPRPRRAMPTGADGELSLRLPLRHGGLLIQGRLGSARMEVLPPRSEGAIEVRLAQDDLRLAATVVDSEQRPISTARAELLWRRSSLAATACEPDGSFDLGPIDPQGLEVRLSAPGHQTRIVPAEGVGAAGRSGPLILIGKDPKRSTDTARTTAEEDEIAGVTLRVTDEEGQPLVGARLERHDTAPGDYARWLGDPRKTVPTAATDEQGLARISAAANLQLWFVVRAPGHEPALSGPHRARRTTDAAATVELSRGRTIGGSVIDADGRPVPGCPVEVVRNGSRIPLVTDAEGRFGSPPIAAGLWTVTAQAPAGFGHLGRSAPRELDLEADALPLLELRLAP
jgi:hypothetical protein